MTYWDMLHPKSLCESWGCLRKVLQLHQGGCPASSEQRDGGRTAARGRHLPAASPAALCAPSGALAASTLCQGRVHQEPAGGTATVMPDICKGQAIFNMWEYIWHIFLSQWLYVLQPNHIN